MAGLASKFAQHAQALGGGPTLTLSASSPTLTEISLGQIEVDPNQPRKDLGDLVDLTASIRELGVIQPIIVSIIGYEKYRVLAGERRFTAAKLAGLAHIPAIVRSVEEHDRLALQLVENLHRKDLNPVEEALSYQQLISEFGLSHEKLGARLGKTQVSVTETLRILDLPQEILREFQDGSHLHGRISKSLLLQIARRSPSELPALWEAAKQGTLTVRAARTVNTKKAKKVAKAIGRTGGGAFRYPIALLQQKAQVTIEFAAARPRLEDIVDALEEALTIERARLSCK